MGVDPGLTRCGLSVIESGHGRHVTALDVVYTGVITRHRAVIGELEELDLVTQDLLIDHVEQLELFQWFVRAHLENAGGELTDGHEPAADQRGIADH